MLAVLLEENLKNVAIAGLLILVASSYGQLWDNGGFGTGVTSSNGFTAPSGTQWSELQSVGGTTNTILGFGLNYLAAGGGIRVADDFTVTGAGWNITSATVFAYQTGSTTTSTLTSGVLEIWNGVPGGGGSVVFGDTTTNRLTSSTFSNIYRIGNAGGSATSTTRPVMSATLSVGTTLGPGTYWIDYGVAGSLASGPFGPDVTIVGQLGKAGANAVQWNLTAWVPLIDTATSGTGTAPQDMPFILTGTPVPEPASIAALGIGFLALIRRRRRR